jgi:hypothetical protein
MIGIIRIGIIRMGIVRHQGGAEAEVEKSGIIHTLIATAVKKPDIGGSVNVLSTERKSSIHEEENTRVANANVPEARNRVKAEGPKKTRTFQETNATQAQTIGMAETTRTFKEAHEEVREEGAQEEKQVWKEEVQEKVGRKQAQEEKQVWTEEAQEKLGKQRAQKEKRVWKEEAQETVGEKEV